MMMHTFIAPCALPYTTISSRSTTRRRPQFMASTSSLSVTSTPFTVRNAEGISLSCLLDKTPSKTAPLYVLVHGFRDSKNGRFISKLSTTLYQQGAQTCRFDCTGNGESEGDFQYANYRSEAEDLRAVVEHLRCEGHTIAGVAGHSKGAGVVIIYAQKYGDVPLVAALAPRYVMNVGIEERFGKETLEQVRTTGKAEVVNAKDGFKFILTKESIEERETLDMGEIAKGISENTRVFIVHGDKDEVIPVKDADKFERDIKNCEKVIISGANHSFRGMEEQVAEAFFNG